MHQQPAVIVAVAVVQNGQSACWCIYMQSFAIMHLCAGESGCGDSRRRFCQVTVVVWVGNSILVVAVALQASWAALWMMKMMVDDDNTFCGWVE